MDIPKRLNQAVWIRRRRKSWQRVVRVMAAVVVFCTTYSLILPAITMEVDTVCGLSEHTHSEQCYEIVSPTECTLAESEGHTHGDNCYETAKTLVCLLEEVEPHQHDSSCHTETVICGIEEHAAHSHSPACNGTVETLLCTDTAEDHHHEGTCYNYEPGLVCGLEETAGHTHGEACVKSELGCGREETAGYTHGDDCYTVTSKLVCQLEESEGHSHESDVLEELVCELTEHAHSDSCYPATVNPTDETTDETTDENTDETTEETTLPEGDPTADLETAADWEASVSSATLTGSRSEDIRAIARTQLGYTESQENYIYNENGEIRGYTRYGEWYGSPYGDWSAMFVSFCLHYAKIDIPYAQNCQSWLETLNAVGIYRAAAQYTPASGDLIFFDQNADNVCDHVGIVEAAETDSGMVQYYVGDHNDQVAWCKLPLNDTSILGYAMLTEKTAEEPCTYTSQDGTYTQVVLPAGTDVPADADLTVTTVMEGTEQYTAMADLIQQSVTETVVDMTLLDISFYDAAGGYLSVSDTAQVSLCYDGDIFGANTVKVFHFVDGIPVELENVSVACTAGMAEDGTESTQTMLTFETDGFSVFAVVSIGETSSSGDNTYKWVTKDAAELAGEYYISCNDENRTIANVVHGTYTSALNYYTNSKQTVWTLTQVSGNTYKIHSGGNYMVMGTDGSLTLSTDETSASVFTATLVDLKYYTFYANGYYINEYGGHNGIQGFRGESDPADEDNTMILYSVVDADTGSTDSTENIVTGLDGQSFAIVSNNESKALITQTATVNSVSGLASAAISFTTVDAERYVSGDVPLWTFEKAATDGAYNIYTNDASGNKQYLTFTSTYGALTLRSLQTENTWQQAVYVISTGDGSVYLTVKDANGNAGYLNLDQTGGDTYWVFNNTADSNEVLLCQTLNSVVLAYNLGAPAANGWDNTPSISTTQQNVTADGISLLSVNNKNAVGTFVYNSISGRGDIRSYYTNYNQNNPDKFLSPGAEWRFLGWQATIGGSNYLFAENAAATMDDTGSIRITDVDGVERILPSGTTLTGQWDQICEVVMFFVNFGDTMLETENDQDISGTGSSYYTGVVAVGHIYDPTNIPPSDSTEQNIVKKSNNALIQAEITPEYDPSVSGTQVVIDAVSVLSNGTSTFTPVTNYNQIQLEEAVGAYLRNSTDSNTEIKIDNATVEREDINTENYKLFWYKQIPVSNEGWHVDGVLVAETQPVEIYTTFSGLTRDQANAAIANMTFPLYLIHTADGTDKAMYYNYLDADKSAPGIYTYDGVQSTTSNIYKWTLQSIQGQRYAFQELGYAVDGYDYSSLISVHYTDGTIEYHNNTDASATGLPAAIPGGTTASKYTVTDLFSKDLIGGEIESVIFANFYTSTGTGAFSVSKVDSRDTTTRLAGAKFSLWGDEIGKEAEDFNGNIIEAVTTNENGAAHFSNLAPGTYILQETAAPSGYQASDQTWEVVVANNGSVTIGGTLVYDPDDGGIKQVYQVKNKPIDTTLTITKTFSGLTDEQMTAMETADSYSIALADSNNASLGRYWLSDSTEVTGSTHTYRWTITLTQDDKNLTLTEAGFRQSPLGTTVTATVNGAAVPVEVSEIGNYASFEVELTDSADNVTITNTYIDTFRLKLKKVDSEKTSTVLTGAEFKVYTPIFNDSPTGEEFTYTDSGGTHRVYLLGTATDTNADGIYEFGGLKLATTYDYVLRESQAPTGYVKLDEPILFSVPAGSASVSNNAAVKSASYSNGVMSMTVKNTSIENSKVSVTANVAWQPAVALEPTLTLYRSADSGKTFEVVGSAVTVSADNNWTATWADQPYADDSGNAYSYYVSEAYVPGYNTSYSTYESQVAEGVLAGIAMGTELNRSVTITNTAGFELPDTGGIGILPGTTAGLLMTAAGLYAILLRRKRERRPD